LTASTPPTTKALSIVITVLNDAPALGRLLDALAGSAFEIIVVDGGSRDHSAELAERAGARLVRSDSGRGLQLDCGFRAAAGDWIWMLHADAAPSPANLA